MLSTRIAKDVDRSVISFPATITPFSDQLLAEDDETVNKKFEASFFSLPVLRLRPLTVLDDLLALLPLVAARTVVQKLRLNQGKDPFNSFKEKDWSDQPKRTSDF